MEAGYQYISYRMMCCLTPLTGFSQRMIENFVNLSNVHSYTVSLSTIEYSNMNMYLLLFSAVSMSQTYIEYVLYQYQSSS